MARLAPDPRFDALTRLNRTLCWVQLLLSCGLLYWFWTVLRRFVAAPYSDPSREALRSAFLDPLPWIGALGTLLAFGWMIAWLFWVHRMVDRVRQAGAEGFAYTPRQAVWAFLYPVANLFLPYLVFRDAWRASASPQDCQEHLEPALLLWWWILVLAAVLVDCGAYGMWRAPRESVDAGGVALVMLVSELLLIFSVLLQARVVRQFHRLQQGLERLDGPGGQQELQPSV